MIELTLKLKATIGQAVKVKDLESEMVVRGYYFNGVVTKYEVDYFHNGDRKSAYLHASEFEVVSAR